MKQIYVGSTEKVYINLFLDGNPVNGDTPPTFSLTIEDSDIPARTGTSINESTGVYYFLTEFDEIDAERVLKVEWEYAVSGDTYARTDYISVVTPYINFADLRALAPEGTSEAELENAELFARYMINDQTGQTFGKRRKTINVPGNNQPNLVLNERIISLESIDVNGESVWTADPVYNNFGREVVISDTNYGLTGLKNDGVPTWGENSFTLNWKSNYRYTITGLFGYEQVPEEIKYCARLLAEDYFCNDTAWKKRYVQQINASDWRVVFSPKQFNGTGNFFVDQILSSYKSIGMVIV